jgi:hypothetical protein
MASVAPISRKLLTAIVVATLTLAPAQVALSGNLPTSTGKDINTLNCKELLKLRKTIKKKLKDVNFKLEVASKDERLASGYLDLWNENSAKIDKKLKAEKDPKTVKSLKKDKKEARRLTREWEQSKKSKRREVNKQEREKQKLDNDMKRIKKAGKKSSCGPKVSA